MHCKDASKTLFIIKDLWQYPEHKEKGKLLYKVIEKGVVNITKYYHHKTVCVGRQDNNIYNIYKGLNITKVINYKPEGLIMPLRLTRVQKSTRQSQNYNRKRSFSCSTLILLNKCLCLTSPTKCPII